MQQSYPDGDAITIDQAMWRIGVCLLVLELLHGWGLCRGPCDPLVPEYCPLPFPNSFFTAPSAQSLTGLRVNFSAETFPRDILRRGVNPGEWNTLGQLERRPRGSCTAD